MIVADTGAIIALVDADDRHHDPAQDAFFTDLAASAFKIDWGNERDVARAHDLHARHRALRLGLVDGVVIATAERLRATAIATLDVRHFAAVSIRGRPKLLPRDKS